MSLGLYMDHNFDRAVTVGLRRRTIDVLTAHEDGHARADDTVLLARATALDRLLVTYDRDLLRIAAEWQRTRRRFAGIVFVRSDRIGVGQLIDELELVARVYEPHDVENLVRHLPL